MGLFDALFGKKSDATRAPQSLNIDNDYFFIKDGRLLEYRGKEDTIVVPRGVQIIGGDDTAIWNKTIDTIFIPNTVRRVSDLALPYVETVYYEGSQNSLIYDKQYNFYENGWITDWSKSNQHPVRVNEVRFHFGYQHYAQIEKAHYDKHPIELLSKTSK